VAWTTPEEERQWAIDNIGSCIDKVTSGEYLIYGLTLERFRVTVEPLKPLKKAE